jgi:hypothetical protein
MTENSSTHYLILKDDHWHGCLEDSYGFLRTSWQGHWLGMPAVLGHCMRFLNPHENHFSKAARSMLDAAQSVALEIENQNQITPSLTEPKYHNRLHFADALTSMSILLSILFQLDKKANHDWMACALLTCIAHDFLHLGKVNRFESEIEKKSVDFLKPILSLHRVPDEWQKVIETAIVRSDFAIAHHNHANVKGKSFEWDLKWLCVLLNEADVMASASSKYGPELGESLAQEWRLIDFPLHASVASIEGRKTFLKQLLFSSPASLVLGLNERVSDEIRSMLRKRI